MNIAAYVNIGMWVMNTVVWAAYAHSALMAVFSLGGVLASVMLKRLYEEM